MSRGSVGAVLGCLLVLGTSSHAAADPVVSPGGGNSGTVGTVITIPGTPGGQAAGRGGVQPVSSSGPPACTYSVLTPEQAIVAGMPVPDAGGVENVATAAGAYYLRDCLASGRGLVWIPDAIGGAAPLGVPVVTQAELALEVRNRLQLPVPQVGVSPDGANQNPALVNLPTWWWVSNTAELTQRTEAGPVWAEVTAEAVSTSWTAGDGTRSDCSGLGIAWQSWMGETQHGSCRHTYTRANAEEKAQVAVVWRVTWVGSGGTGGALDPMTMTTVHDIAVYERQAIVTNG